MMMHYRKEEVDTKDMIIHECDRIGGGLGGWDEKKEEGKEGGREQRREREGVNVSVHRVVSCINGTLRKISKAADALRGAPLNSVLEKRVDFHSKMNSCCSVGVSQSEIEAGLRGVAHALNDMITHIKDNKEGHFFTTRLEEYVYQLNEKMINDNEYYRISAECLHRKLKRLVKDKLNCLVFSDIYLDILLILYRIRLPGKQSEDYRLLGVMMDEEVSKFKIEYDRCDIEIDASRHSLAIAAVVLGKRDCLEVIASRLLSESSDHGYHYTGYLSVLSAGLMSGEERIWSIIIKYVYMKMIKDYSVRPYDMFKTAVKGTRKFSVQLPDVSDPKRVNIYFVTFDKTDTSLQVDINDSKGENMLTLLVVGSENGFRMYQKNKNQVYTEIHTLFDILNVCHLFDQIKKIIVVQPHLLHLSLSFLLNSNLMPSDIQPSTGMFCLGKTQTVSGIKCTKHYVNHTVDIINPKMFNMMHMKPNSLTSQKEYLEEHFRSSVYPFDYISKISNLAEDSFEKRYSEMVSNLHPHQRDSKCHETIKKYADYLHSIQPKREILRSEVWVAGKQRSIQKPLPWESVQQTSLILSLLDISAIPLSRTSTHIAFSRLIHYDITGIDINLPSRQKATIRLISTERSMDTDARRESRVFSYDSPPIDRLEPSEKIDSKKEGGPPSASTDTRNCTTPPQLKPSGRSSQKDR